MLGKRALATAAATKSSAKTISNCKSLLRKARGVCFDVDSTVVNCEGIDVLAAHLGRGDEVAAWTAKAMGGDVKFEDALAARLDIIKPNREDVEACLKAHPPTDDLTPGIQELVKLLLERGQDVFLVSGGFRQMIAPVAATLGLPPSHVIANNLLFDEETGIFTGFDANEPTSRSGGKPRALQYIIDEKYGGDGGGGLVMVGDGATDAEARPPATAFIGFGGVADRPAVREQADWFVKDFDEIIACLRET